ncbi:mannuronate-specific alginate lyase [Pseudomonas typographi]|uniref:Alginate lyase n=1 Tax=Pseudomonas typographi TaxID=2715964 RepID=A0ABR7YYJ3_9PSED|nr:mannuronate-specific alginate lyase [Pseudomonas typographi]MBD1550813.1 mannuronate-specific alginate lyase [Pseudomonas typographi]MBD1587755.1 mannuronate-specific alginate lyase [Pseudomonas typographi]MBD1598278.1 mannuronate-specific alginate lyase [Pseudomonas typographi]
MNHVNTPKSRNLLPRVLASTLLGLALVGPAAWAAGTLVPPQGYYEGIEKAKDKDDNFSCPAVPKPYTDTLQFRSKYEGSDKSRSTFNAASDQAFRDATKDITNMERGVSKLVMQYMRDGRPAQLDCTLNWLTTWAQAGALESTDFNHTGKSMRKWALGSMSSSYLRLKFSEAHPLQGHEQQAQQIEAWFSKLGDQVVSDWSNQPLERVNNHFYWAAWSVMATAVVTNRRDLFDWSVKEYKTAASQVDPDGFLPNELKRQQRALSYHNYALPPLMMIASFAQANGVDLRGENNGALQRLADRVLTGSKDPSAFQAKNGQKQDMTDLKVDSKYAWLEPYCTLYTCSPDTLQRKRDMEPFKTFRLGGDLTRTFDPAGEKNGKGQAKGNDSGDEKDHDQW